MPQGRRKVPFSGKAKKEQLKAKKHGNPVLLKEQQIGEHSTTVDKINFHDGSKTNKYALQFFKETKEEIIKQKELARCSLERKEEEDLEIDADLFFNNDLDFPIRPYWEHGLSKDKLEQQENHYFTEYIKGIEKKFDIQDLSLFELNIETWRQLWRVLEMSDIILFIIDIRFASAMFPPSLYNYVTKILGKNFILVLNKIDLAPASVVVAWKYYFEEKYPDLNVVLFTTLPGYNLMKNQCNAAGLQLRRQKGRIRMATEGAQQILNICQTLVTNEIDLSSWHDKIKEETKNIEDETIKIEETLFIKNDTDYYKYEKYYKGILTIGCIGQPNVGKSSLMNALIGKKLVSVSKTPGHTKHFQTIYLTKNVKLCDCPGLIFPSKVPKPLQVLMGSYPIAQLRQPFMTIKYLAERLDLVKLLRINDGGNDGNWSAMDVCDGWAEKRGYYTAKAARLDSYRAANGLLRMALDGKICLCFRPPGYVKKKEYWSTHPDIKTVERIQAKNIENLSDIDNNLSNSDTDEKNYERDKKKFESDSTDTEDDHGGIEIASNKFSALVSE